MGAVREGRRRWVGLADSDLQLDQTQLGRRAAPVVGTTVLRPVRERPLRARRGSLTSEAIWTRPALRTRGRRVAAPDCPLHGLLR